MLIFRERFSGTGCRRGGSWLEEKEKGSWIGLLEGGVWRKGKKDFGLRRDLSGMNTQYFFSLFFSYFLLCLHSLLFQAHIRCLNVGIIGHMFIAIISLDCCALPR